MLRTLWRSYIPLLFKHMRYRLITGLVIIISNSLLSGLGLLTLIPLLSLIGLNSGESTNAISRFFIGFFDAFHLPVDLVSILIFFVIVNVISSSMNVLQSTYLFRLKKDFILKLQVDLYEAIFHTRWLFWSKKRTSDFMNALLSEIREIEHLTFQFLNLLSSVILSTFYICVAFKMSFLLTSVTLILGLVIVLFLQKKVRYVQKAGQKISNRKNELFAILSEHLAGMKLSKIYSLEKSHKNAFVKINEDFFSFREKANYHTAYRNFLFSSSSIIVLSIFIYTSIEVLKLSISEMIILAIIFSRIMPILSRLQGYMESIGHLLHSFKRIIRLQKECEDNSESYLDPQKIFFDKQIYLQNVSFQYSTEKVLEDVCLKINKAETVAIVGNSGAGKTTLVNILLGLLRPMSGQILLDEIPLNEEHIKSWRQKIGYVSQDIFLFNDTIYNNLICASPNATDDKVMRALEIADAKKFVSELADGWNTVLGERGIRLSGGQKQRISLSQAILREPQILILDEATSALDSESEHYIQTSIEQLHGQITIIVITHRLSTIANADKICVLDDHTIVEMGTWNELLQNKGKFYRMWQKQFKGILTNNETDIAKPENG